MQSMLSLYTSIDTLLPSMPTLPCLKLNEGFEQIFLPPPAQKLVARNNQRLFVVGRQLDLVMDNEKMNCTRFLTTAFFAEIDAPQPAISQHP